MKKLINVSMYMSILSLIQVSESMTSLVISLIVSGAVYFLGHHAMRLVKKVEVVYEFTLTHLAVHANINADIKRIDLEIEEMKDHYKQIEKKLDQLLSEMKKST